MGVTQAADKRGATDPPPPPLWKNKKGKKRKKKGKEKVKKEGLKTRVRSGPIRALTYPYQEEKYTGAGGELAPEMQKRAPESHKSNPRFVFLPDPYKGQGPGAASHTPIFGSFSDQN